MIKYNITYTRISTTSWFKYWYQWKKYFQLWVQESHIFSSKNLQQSKHVLKQTVLKGVVVSVMVFNATFNNISFISWWSVLLVEETMSGIRKHNFSGVRH